MNRISALLDSLNTGEQWIFRIAAVAVVFGCIGITVISLSYFTHTTADYGGTYTEGMVGYPTTPNPILATTSTDQSLSRLVYSGILRKISWNTYKSDIGSCSSTTKSNSIVCTISNNAYFHDGNPVSADDILFTMETIQKIGERSPWYPSLVGVTISKENEKTVRFDLPKSFSGFNETLTIGIMPRHLWQDVPVSEIEGRSTLEKMMVGSGPFTVFQHSSSGDHIKSTTLKSYNNFISGSPYISSIKLFYYPSTESMITAFNKNNVDGIVIESEDSKKIESINKTYQRIPIVHPDIYGIMTKSSLQTEKNLLSELDEYLRYYNFSEYGFPWSKPLPPWNAQELLDLSNTYDKISSIGYKNKVRTEPGSSDSPRVLVTVDQESLIRLASTLSKALNTIGLPTEMRVFDFSGFKNSVIPKRSFNFLVFGQRYRHISDAFAYWNSSERLDPGLNVTETVDSSIDNYANSIAREAHTDTEIQDIYEKLNSRIKDEQVLLPLFLDRDIYILNPAKSPIHQPLIYNPTIDRFNSVVTWYLRTTLEFK